VQIVASNLLCGYDIMLLPVVLESAATLSQCLDRATKDMDNPNARKKKPYSKLHLHSLQNLVSIRRYLERQKSTAGKNKRQIASLLTPIYP
jgi:hypothetical protein